MGWGAQTPPRRAHVPTHRIQSRLPTVHVRYRREHLSVFFCGVDLLPLALGFGPLYLNTMHAARDGVVSSLTLAHVG